MPQPRMRQTVSLASIVVAWAALVAAQAPTKELLTTLSGPVIESGIVSELLWEGRTVIIQVATRQADGQLAATRLKAPNTPGDSTPLPAASSPGTPPLSADDYWEMKASRTSPNGRGTIVDRTDSSVPMVGVGKLQDRMLNSAQMGGMNVTYELRLGRLVLFSRTGSQPPYDGEVWGWSSRELNRIAYVDGKGDLWTARADGAGAGRLMRGTFTLPAWSDDGRFIAVVERKKDGAVWDVSVVHVPEKFRR
jgi:hypothetical protein